MDIINLFSYVMLKLYTEFQCPTLPETGAGGVGGVVWWCVVV